MAKIIPLAAVIGHPVAHSKSPQLHQHWLNTNNLQGYYIPMDVSDANFAQVVPSLYKMGFVGANVTLPHKTAALNIAHSASDTAKEIGAANTLVFGLDGEIYADNTDAYGFITNLKQNAPMWRPNAGPACVLGAGGAAKSVLWALHHEGVSDIYLINRTRASAEILARQFPKTVHVVDWSDMGAALKSAALLVNTTSLGMDGKPPLNIAVDKLRPKCVVNDLVYAPLQTQLLKSAAQAGHTPVDGLGMLLHQGALSFKIWFGILPQVDQALRDFVLT